MASARQLPLAYNTATYGSAGRDYTSLATWEAATDTDLVAAQMGEVLECYSEGSPYADFVTLSDEVSNADYFRAITVAEGHRHGGTLGTGVVFSPTSQGTVFALGGPYCRIHDVAVDWQRSTSIFLTGIFIYQANIGIRAVGCLARVRNTGSGGTIGIDSKGSVINCIALECKNFGIAPSGGAGDVCYNNTAVGCATGFWGGNTNIRARNNLASGNTTGFGGSYGAASSHNASSDATAPGTNSRQSQVFSFVDAPGGDYRLADSDTGALGFGVDLSADSVFPFDDDVNYNLWRSIWGMGFHKAGIVGTGPKPGHSYQYDRAGKGWHRTRSN